MMKRRDFFGVAALGAGSLALGSLAARETAETEEKSTDPVGLVSLTKDVKCSRIGYGTGMRGGNRVSDMVPGRLEKEHRTAQLRLRQRDTLLRLRRHVRHARHRGRSHEGETA